MKKGFTLIEMLVVFAIIGVIAASSIAMLNPSGKLKSARDSKRKADLIQIQSALEFYRSDQGSYPSSITACGTSFSFGGTTYMKSVPCDPNNTGQFKYTYVPSGSPAVSYLLIACLEDVTDTQKDAVNNTAYCTGGTTNWSFTATNP